MAMSVKDARELILMMESMRAYMGILRDRDAHDQEDEVHAIYLGLEEQWDMLPDRTRAAASEGLWSPRSFLVDGRFNRSVLGREVNQHAARNAKSYPSSSTTDNPGRRR